MNETKVCLVCGNIYIKPYKEGKKAWAIRKYCSKKCQYIGRSIITPIEMERRRKQTLAMVGNKCGFKKGFAPWNKGLKGVMTVWNKGKKTGLVPRSAFKKGHKTWNRGETPDLNHLLRKQPEYFVWRKAVYTRDYWTCQDCDIKGKDIVAHHIFGFADFPSLRYEVNNGITLCRSCHKKRHSNIGKEYRFKKKELVYGRTG